MAQVNKAKEHSKHSKGTQNGFCKQLKAFLFAMFSFLRYGVDLLIDKLFGLYYDTQRTPIPHATNPILLESAVSLAEKIRKRELTSEEIVQTFIDRIKQVNGVLNAVIDTRFEEALKEAKAIDMDIATGSVIDADFHAKPFLGVPFTTKESTACKGMSFTFGLESRKFRKAQFDAEIVELMRDAGAILIAVTNVPQINLWVETHNPVFGVTKNPYNSTRNVGGSSGGEGSIIAAGGSPFGLGTDIGGSLRIPAFMCGIYGHKPSPYVTSTKGLTFRSGDEGETMVVAGPMTKHANDLAPLLKVLVGSQIDKLKLNEPVNLKKLKIYYVTDPKDPKISPIREEMNRALLKCVEHFERVSVEKPEELDVPELKYGGKLWRYWMTQEPGVDFNRDIANREGRINSILEIIKICLRQSQFTLYVMFNLVNGLLPQENGRWAREQTDLLHKKLTDSLDENSVLLYPSAPFPASYHHSSLLRPWNFHFFCIWNALKFPVTQVPLGLNKDGLPLGIQIVAAPFQDHLGIAVAKELERAFGGYIPPFNVVKIEDNVKY